jgi:hypothetical protein
MLALNIFVTSGMALHVVGVLVAGGLTEGRAVPLASLIGPVQVGIRAMQIGMSDWWRPITWAIFGATLLPLGALCLLGGVVADGQTICFAVVFCLLVGMSNGLIVVARAAVPLEIFGATRYGTWTGRLGASQNIATAVTPVAFAAALRASSLK